MRDLLFLKTGLTDLKKLQINIKFYQALGVDYLVVGPNPTFFKENIEGFFALNETYFKANLGLVFSFDIKVLMENLLGLEMVNMTEPKIRKGLYHFLAYLIKHGVRAFDLKGLENLESSEKYLLPSIRELNKNTFFNREVLSMGEIYGPKETLLALANPNLSALSLVRIPGEVGDLLSLSSDFSRVNSGITLTPKNFSKDGINFKNYPKSAKRLVFMTLFFLKASLFIEENDLDFEDLVFLRGLFALKNKSARLVGVQKILPKEKDILAFIRQGDDSKILFLANLTEREILLDLAFKVMDYKDYHFLAGSLSHRTLYRTLVLRPYEAIAFENCK